MPIISRLDFAAHGLLVSYRTSDAPQAMVLELESDGPLRLAAICVRNLVQLVNAGGAGGSDFPPTSGIARVVLTSPPETERSTYGRWDISVGGVSPYFLRMMVDQMRTAAAERDVTGLRVRGSIPLDASALSVTTAKVRAWLDDPSAYPGLWRHSEFPVIETDNPEMTMRVYTKDTIDSVLRDRLEQLFSGWFNAVAHVIGDDGREVDLARSDTFPVYARSKREFRALFPRFPHDPRASLSILCNMLFRFHREQSSILELELSA